MPYLGNVPAEAYSQVSYQDLTGGSGTSFTLDYPVGSAGEIEVFVNNVRQEPTVAYTVSGTSLTMTGSIAATDDFYVVFQGKAQQTIGIPEKQTDGTYVFPDDVTVNGDLTVDTDTLVVDAANNRVGIGTASPAAASLQIKKDTASTTNELLRLSNGAGSTTDGVKLVMEIANTSGNGGEIGTVRDGGSFNPYMYFSTSAGVGSSPVERMRIDSSGNVGIGTTSPDVFSRSYTRTVGISSSGSTSLAIQSASGPQYPAIEMGRGSSRQFLITNEAAKSTIGTLENTPLTFLTNSSEAMRIDSDQSVLIGIDSSAGLGTKDGLYFGPSGASIYTRSTTSSVNFFEFFNPNGKVGSIVMNSSSTSYNTSSDYRLKENVTDLTGASDRINQIPVHRFNFIVDPDRTVDGFLAHEVQAVVPEAVTGTQDAMRDEEYEVTPAVYEDVIIPAVLDDEGNEIEPERTEQRLVTEAVMGTRQVPDYQGIDQSKLVPLLTAALQEALAKIETLETEMTSVKARLEALETA